MQNIFANTHTYLTHFLFCMQNMCFSRRFTLCYQLVHHLCVCVCSVHEEGKFRYKRDFFSPSLSVVSLICYDYVQKCRCITRTCLPLIAQKKEEKKILYSRMVRSLMQRHTHTHRTLMQKKSISMLNLGICESVYVENWQRSVESFVVLSQNNISRDLYRCCLSLCSVCILKKSLFSSSFVCWKIKFIFDVQKFIHVHIEKRHTHIQ